MDRMPYTIRDLEEARSELKRASDRAANHRGNNPDFGQADIRAARRKVEFITDELKAAGVLLLTDQEKLQAELDKRFPNARSREIVEHNGKRYQRRFAPAEKSRSGKTVMHWDRWWEEVKEAK